MREKRDEIIILRTTKAEKNRIYEKMLGMGIRSLSAYIRKMALDGYCLHLDLKELRRMAYLLQMCSNNLNQYAKCANESGQVYAADLEDLRIRLDELISIAFLNATESTGLQLGLDSYRAPWKIICIRTAFKEYKTYGADLYKEALTMLARGWEGDPDSLRSGILQGMMRFVALYQGEYDPERLVKRLHTVHPMTLVRDEKSLSGTVRYKYMMLILRTYNGASRRRNLPIKP